MQGWEEWREGGREGGKEVREVREVREVPLCGVGWGGVPLTSNVCAIHVRPCSAESILRFSPCTHPEPVGFPDFVGPVTVSHGTEDVGQRVIARQHPLHLWRPSSARLVRNMSVALVVWATRPGTGWLRQASLSKEPWLVSAWRQYEEANTAATHRASQRAGEVCVHEREPHGVLSSKSEIQREGNGRVHPTWNFSGAVEYVIAEYVRTACSGIFLHSLWD